MRPALLAVLLCALLAAVPVTAAADGPALTVGAGDLERATACPGGLGRTARPVVLLVHGTGSTARESWAESLGRTLPARGYDRCTVQLPERALVDIQRSAEYVVGAVRAITARTGRRVSLVGHSQGAAEIRWAVRFWPDVRASVDDLVTLAGANQGLATADEACGLGRCAEPVWQLRTAARFVAALNAVPISGGPSSTAVWSPNDEVIRPASAATFAGATNVAPQDVCPGRYVGHVTMLYDAVAVAVLLDALDHPGPAAPARIDRSVCAAALGPGMDPVAATVAANVLWARAAAAIATARTVDREPPLRDHVTAGAPAGAAPPAPPTTPTATPVASPAPARAGRASRRARTIALRLRPATVRRRSAGRTRLVLALDGAATVALGLERRARGRWARLPGTVTIRARAGRTVLRLVRAIPALRRLGRGGYRLVATPEGGAPARVAFRVR